MKRVVIPRHQPLEVSQEYLDANRHLLNKKWWRIEGDAGITVDEGDDGVPDAGWTKKDITAWMKEKGLEVGGYATKATLLKSVNAFLNPEPVAEPTAEVLEEAEAETPTGDE
jgi:hypothetical protein|tara:strand:+ start:335 stop:670 length:336 start_codon:yes stop_codon:yes gene_type:complete